MFERLAQIEIRFEEIEAEMARPETLANMEEYKKLAKERTELKDVVDIYREWKKKTERALKGRGTFQNRD
jgi:peptide chain release factor 1